MATGITDLECRNVEARERLFKLNAGTAGLYLAILPSGAKVWRRDYQLAGARRTQSLGTFLPAGAGPKGKVEVSLAEARAAALKSKQLVQQGLDPIELARGAAASEALAARAEQARLQAEQEVRRRAKAEAAAVKASDKATLARVARGYHERIEAKFRNAKHRQQWINSLEQHVPAAVWRKPIADIRAGELIDMLAEVQRRVPETGSRVQQRLAAVFEDATLRKLVDRNAMVGVRRAVRELVGSRKRRNFSSLAYSEVPTLMKSLATVRGVSATALQFTILCAARTGEVLGATWSEVGLEAAAWVVPAGRMKAGEPHTVPLSPQALEILQARRDEIEGAGHEVRPNGLVFASPGSGEIGSKLSSMAMLLTLRRLGIADRATVHGMRSAFSTWANERAVARADVIEAALAHREADRVRASYNRAKFDAERRELLDRWGVFCASDHVRAEVVDIASARTAA